MCFLDIVFPSERPFLQPEHTSVSVQSAGKSQLSLCARRWEESGGSGSRASSHHSSKAPPQHREGGSAPKPHAGHSRERAACTGSRHVLQTQRFARTGIKSPKLDTGAIKLWEHFVKP